MLWRCRRGIRELDSILMPFTENCYEQLSTIDKIRLQTLLDYQDTQILDWILEREIPNNKGLQNLITTILRYSKESNGA